MRGPAAASASDCLHPACTCGEAPFCEPSRCQAQPNLSSALWTTGAACLTICQSLPLEREELGRSKVDPLLKSDRGLACCIQAFTANESMFALRKRRLTLAGQLHWFVSSPPRAPMHRQAPDVSRQCGCSASHLSTVGFGAFCSV